METRGLDPRDLVVPRDLPVAAFTGCLTMSRILNILAMLSTAGWFAAAAGMGLAAAVVFGVVQNLDPALPGWENVDPSMTARL